MPTPIICKVRGPVNSLPVIRPAETPERSLSTLKKYINNPGGRTRHRRLRGALTAAGYDQSELADILGISPTSVSNRMRGKYPWTISEAWAVLDLIGVSDPAQLGTYFPPAGEDDLNG